MIDGNERWLTLEEIALHLSVSKSWLYQSAKLEGFPMHKVGRQYRVKRSQVDSWLESKSHAS